MQICVHILDLNDCFASLFEILHKDTQSMPSLKVFKLMKAIRRTSYTQDNWKEFYNKLVIEAFQYASESGSEKVLFWILNSTCKMFAYIKNDINFHFALLVNCGFIIFNVVLDTRNRYALTNISEPGFFSVVKEYKRHLFYFTEVYKNYNLKTLSSLHALRLVIKTALFVSFSNLTKAESKIAKVRKLVDDPEEHISIMIKALCLHQEGIIARLKSDWSKAKESFLQSFNLLRSHFKRETFQAVYCYNALHGKVILFVIIICYECVFRKGKILNYTTVRTFVQSGNFKIVIYVFDC